MAVWLCRTWLRGNYLPCPCGHSLGSPKILTQMHLTCLAGSLIANHDQTKPQSPWVCGKSSWVERWHLSASTFWYSRNPYESQHGAFWFWVQQVPAGCNLHHRTARLPTTFTRTARIPCQQDRKLIPGPNHWVFPFSDIFHICDF